MSSWKSGLKISKVSSMAKQISFTFTSCNYFYNILRLLDVLLNFPSPQVKGYAIIAYKHGIYGMPQNYFAFWNDWYIYWSKTYLFWDWIEIEYGITFRWTNSVTRSFVLNLMAWILSRWHLLLLSRRNLDEDRFI